MPAGSRPPLTPLSQYRADNKPFRQQAAAAAAATAGQQEDLLALVEEPEPEEGSPAPRPTALSALSVQMLVLTAGERDPQSPMSYQ